MKLYNNAALQVLITFLEAKKLNVPIPFIGITLEEMELRNPSNNEWWEWMYEELESEKFIYFDGLFYNVGAMFYQHPQNDRIFNTPFDKFYNYMHLLKEKNAQ